MATISAGLVGGILLSVALAWSDSRLPSSINTAHILWLEAHASPMSPVTNLFFVHNVWMLAVDIGVIR